MKSGVESAGGKPWRFTLVLQYLRGLSQEPSPLSFTSASESTVKRDVYTRPAKAKPLFKLAAGEGGLTWMLNTGQTLNRKLSIWFP